MPQEPPSGPVPDPDHDPGAAPEESAYELLQRGHALMRKRHNAQAAVVLERAARLEPGKGSILEALARARFNAGQHELAREAFEALLEVDPSSHYAHYGLGRSLRNLGREREGWPHLRLAAALAPSSPLYRNAVARIPPAVDRAATGTGAPGERRASTGNPARGLADGQHPEHDTDTSPDRDFTDL